jgi:tetratricopeptide (TPR) repeat protein
VVKSKGFGQSPGASPAGNKSRRRLANLRHSDPTNPVASLLALALKQFQTGQLAEAERLYHDILAQHPQQPEALHWLGVIAYQTDRPDQAFSLWRQALVFNPNDANLHNSLGTGLKDQGNFEEAVSHLQQALALNPDHYIAHTNLGQVLFDLGDLQTALYHWQQAIRLNVNYAPAHNGLGILYKQQGDLEQADYHAQQAIALDPNDASFHNTLGGIWQDRGDWEAAVCHYQTALSLNPDDVGILTNLGTALHVLGRLDEALFCLQRAIALEPNHAPTHYSLGLTRLDQGHLEQAIDHLRQAVSLDPNDSEAHHSLAHALLSNGYYQEGFLEFEWRLQLKQWAPASFPQPLWNGENLSGKTLFLHAEQGFGDTIQFIRYLPFVNTCGGRVILACQPPLRRLLEAMPAVKHSVEQIIEQHVGVEQVLPEFQVHLPLLSLPRIFATTLETIPAQVPYLIAPTHDLQLETRPETRLKVGLVWASGYRGTDLRFSRMHTQKTCPLSLFRPIWSRSDICLYSLQVGRNVQDLTDLGGDCPIQDLAPHIHDFADTAALIAQMDLVISVDTAVAHLAGALSKPVWVLLPFVADWRWLQERQDSPWYPTMQLFRQPSPGDWDSVLTQVVTALQDFLDSTQNSLVKSDTNSNNVIDFTQAPVASSQATVTSLAKSYHDVGWKFVRQNEFFEENALEEAMRNFRQAVHLDPVNPVFHIDLGNALREQGKLEEALHHLQTALSLGPSDARTCAYLHNSLGTVFLDQNRLEEAAGHFRQAIILHPNHYIPHYNLGHTLLALGDFVNGFPEFEWRSEAQSASKPLSLPLWDGSPLEGKTLILLSEAGLGDTLQFIRYTPLIRDRGGRIVLICQSSLKRILELICDIDQILGYNEAIPELNVVYAPMLSLARLLGTTLETIPAQIPYLTIPPGDYPKLTLRPNTVLKVGLVWASGYRLETSDLYKTYLRKSCPLPMLIPLLNVKGVSFYSLQVGHNAIDLAKLDEKYLIQDLSPHIKDFADTAGFIDQLDLIISVDTAVIHLAGALGKPTWVLLPFASDWRWLLGRQDNPWYPTMRLFRQPHPGDWQGVIDHVVESLNSVVDDKLNSMFEPSFSEEHHSTNQETPVSATSMALVDTYNQLGMTAIQQGQLEVASVYFRQAIVLDSYNALAYIHLGNVLLEQGQLEAAAPVLQQALALNPDDAYTSAYAHNSVGTLLLRQGQLQEAALHFSKAIATYPGNALPYSNLGTVLLAQGHPEDAIDAFRRALALKPNDIVAHKTLEKIYTQQRRFDLAVEHLQQIIALDSSDADAYIQLGCVLQEQGQLQAAISNFETALALAPRNSLAHHYLGVALQSQDNIEQAINHLQQALTLVPESVSTLNSLGIIFWEQGYLEEAIAYLQRAIALEPNNAIVHYNLAQVLLSSGDLSNGFAEYEWRWQTEQWTPTQFPQPQWNGSSLVGKTILLHAEQGYGDSIQFIRYATIVKSYGGQVVFKGPASLRDLVLSVSEIDQFVVDHEPLPDFQVHAALMSVPHILKTTLSSIPAHVPYLTPPSHRSLRPIPLLSDTKFKVGLVWSSNNQREQLGSLNAYQKRSCPWECFKRLLSVTAASFYSLQVESSHIDIASLSDEGFSLTDLSSYIEDFADTAALINHMDLVISIDTAVAHLAGALGKPVWILLPYAADWRWLRHRQDSPWYPTAQLFRQSSPGNWDSVIEQIAQSLEDLVNELHDNELHDEARGESQPTEFSSEMGLNSVNLADLAIATTYVNMGVAALNQKRIADAIAYLRQAVGLDPNHIDAHYNLGVALQEDHNPEAAIPLFQKVIALNPNDGQAHNNLGCIFINQGKLEEALVHLRRAVDLRPDDANPHYLLGHVLLLMGDLVNGFIEYESRWLQNMKTLSNSSRCWWDGSTNLAGKTIVIYNEQGFGDAIQFIRYIPLVKASGGRIILVCHPALQRLFGTIREIDQFIVSGTPPEADYHVFLLSLPKCFKTALETIPADIPYLYSSVTAKVNLDRPNTRLKVGLVWASGYPNETYEHRSCPLAKFVPLLSIPGIHFFSLQVGRNATDLATLQNQFPVEDLNPFITDFADTAALINQLDLVISVDTAVAHLAGALGKPVWVLLPFAADWRWMHERRDSPWYPTMRLFRQTSPKDWDSLIEQVAKALKDVIDGVIEPVFELTAPNQSVLADVLTHQLTTTSISDLLKRAFQAHQSGQWTTAEQLYYEILQHQPNQLDALRGLGSIHFQRGQLKEAIACFQKAASFYPGEAQVHNTLGVMLLESGQTQQAITHLQQAISLNPDDFTAYTNLGNALKTQGCLAEATLNYQKAIVLNSNDSFAHNNLGIVLHQQHQPEEAITHLRRAIALNPDYAEVYINLANILKAQGHLEEAAFNYRKAIEYDPGNAIPYNNLGFALSEQGQFTEAVTYLRQAVLLNPDYAEAHHNLGVTLLDQNQFEEAIEYLQRAILLDPHNAKILHNLAYALSEQGKPQEAIDSLRLAISVEPDNAETHYNLAHNLLQIGDFRQGFTEYEWRLQRQIAPKLSYRQSQWNGSSLQGQTILIHAEQGFGDTLQFIRYVPLVSSHYEGRVIFVCPKVLKRLLEPITGIERIVVKGETLPEFQTHISLLSLPHILDTTLETIPNQVPYLVPPVDNRLHLDNLQTKNLKVGLVWASGYREEQGLIKIYQKKSCPLSLFTRFLSIPSISFYSLQIGQHANDISALGQEGEHIQDLSPHIQDFADTAALIAQLDLVISVDTAVAHLAGALGKPVWVLLPFAADWRWLQHREDSPWYPTMRLFRQHSPGDWEAVMRRVFEALQQFVDEQIDSISTPESGYSPVTQSSTVSENKIQSKTPQSLEQFSQIDDNNSHTITPVALNGDAGFLTQKGIELLTQGILDQAIAHFRQALAISPTDPMIHLCLGNALAEQHEPEKAAIHFQTVLTLNPDPIHLRVCAHAGLGHALLDQGQLEAATSHFQSIISLQKSVKSIPSATRAMPYLDLAHVLREQGKLKKALVPLKQAIKIAPDFPEAHSTLAEVLLAMGDFQNGFARHERWRWHQSKYQNQWTPANYIQPMWDGSNLHGKTILLKAEQGFGDVIQFIRYAPWVKAYGGQVVALCYPPLKRLLSTVSGIDHLVADNETLPAFDTYAPLLSLPYILQTTLETIPAQIPYLTAPNELHDVLRQHPNTRLKVGIVWAGGYRDEHYLFRIYKKKSCPFSIFSKLLSISDIHFYSLQIGYHAADLTGLDENYLVDDLSSQIKDFADTAALISQMDLVISVDTAVAHLAGALGKPVWVLLPFVADWRWLQHREDTPWYPTMRLFRQAQPENWKELIARVAQALQILVANKASISSDPEPKSFKSKIQHHLIVAQPTSQIDRLYKQGMMAYKGGEFEEAVVCFQQALTLNPDDIQLYQMIGVTLIKLNKLIEAESCYIHLSELSRKQGNLEAAIHYLQRILQFKSDSADVYYCLGLNLYELGNVEESIKRLHQTIDIQPNHALAFYNLGIILWLQKKPEQAISYYRKAIESKPDFAQAHKSLAQALLTVGDLQNGFAENEWRWLANNWIRPSFAQPLWDGSNLNGKKILLYTEQGFGDAIQFIRYSTLVDQCGGKVIVVIPTILKDLFSTVKGIEQFVTENDPLPEFQVYAALMSLPYILGTTLENVPNSIPYISPPRATPVKLNLLPGTYLKVGCVWASGYRKNKDLIKIHELKSCSLSIFARLLSTSNISFYSLQVGHNSNDLTDLIEISESNQIQDLSPHIKDFADTAALIDQMDLVISVDTAVAHLAGALGKPVWVLLPFIADWRWLQDREDSPWYPTMRLFRQSKPGDWEELVERVAQALQAFCVSATADLLEREFASSKLQCETQGHLTIDKLSKQTLPSLSPNDAVATSIASDIFVLASEHYAAGHLIEAEQLYLQILPDHPEQADALAKLGNIAYVNGAYEEAIDRYQKALKFNPGDVATHNNLGIALRFQGDLEKSSYYLRQAIHLQPEYAEAYRNLGQVLREQGKLKESLDVLRQAIHLQPEYAEAYLSLGLTYFSMGDIQQAISNYQQAIQINPEFAEAHRNLSHALLLTGDFLNGFAEYEWRWQANRWKSLRSFLQPWWDGSDLQGKTILLWPEQGLGDTIQFIRYAQLVSDRGGQIIFVCSEPLKRLIETAPGIQQVFLEGAQLPEFQVHASLLSLPYILATTLETIPNRIPYLTPPTQIIKLEELSGRPFKVGLVWASGYRKTNPDWLYIYRQKSCPLPLYTEILSVPGVSFYSLQVGHDAQDITQLDKQYPLQDLNPYIHDFADTAALIAQLDLIISVDTAVAHLAGAMGKPVWVLLPFVADWRWLQHRQDSPWYPTMRLFRQLSSQDWESVVEQVVETLKRVVEGSLEPVFELETMELNSINCEDMPLTQPPSADVAVDFNKSQQQHLRSVSSKLTTSAMSNMLATALQHYQVGQLEEAEHLYLQILQQQPNHVTALHWLGVILCQTNRLEEGLIYLQQAVALYPHDANFQNSLGVALMDLGYLEQSALHLKQAIDLYPNHSFAQANLGTVLMQLKDLDGAISYLQQAIALNPTDADAHNTLGNALQQQGALEAATTHYHQALTLQPDHAVALTNLGNLLISQRKISDAIHCLQRALDLNPHLAEAHNGLGLGYTQDDRLDQALIYFQHAIALDPNNANFHYNLGLTLQKQTKLEDATASYRRAVTLEPNHTLALTSLGDVLREQDQFEEAIAHLQHALKLDPNNKAVLTYLGFNLHEQGRLEAAIPYLQQAIELAPDDAQAHANLAAILWTQGNLKQAIASYQTAIRLQPDHAEAHLCLAQCLILMGDLRNGFAEYEWRWRTKTWAPHSFPQPLWDGKPLNGRTILIHVEGGFGDIIQFIRYVPLVSDRGGRVIVTCQASLLRLLTTVSGISQIVVHGDPLPVFDVHAPLLTLPYLLETTLETIPNQIPYLSSVDSPGIQLELRPGTTLKVGIAWATGYNTRRDLFKNYQMRSASLSAFIPLLSIPGISFYSLQIGHNAADLSQLDNQYPLQDLSPHIKDFADTAALIDQMDLVISVDTAVIHLAGALGKSVWVLLSRPHDWRWFIDREDTPWYPTMCLFRQSKPGDWEVVIEQVARSLQIFHNNKSNNSSKSESE